MSIPWGRFDRVDMAVLAWILIFQGSLFWIAIIVKMGDKWWIGASIYVAVIAFAFYHHYIIKKAHK